MDVASDRGMATVQYVVTAGLSLLLFVAFANLIVFQYGRGVVRAALDEGVRAGAPLARCLLIVRQDLTGFSLISWAVRWAEVSMPSVM